MGNYLSSKELNEMMKNFIRGIRSKEDNMNEITAEETNKRWKFVKYSITPDILITSSERIYDINYYITIRLKVVLGSLCKLCLSDINDIIRSENEVENKISEHVTLVSHGGEFIYYEDGKYFVDLQVSDDISSLGFHEYNVEEHTNYIHLDCSTSMGEAGYHLYIHFDIVSSENNEWSFDDFEYTQSKNRLRWKYQPFDISNPFKFDGNNRTEMSVGESIEIDLNKYRDQLLVPPGSKLSISPYGTAMFRSITSTEISDGVYELKAIRAVSLGYLMIGVDSEDYAAYTIPTQITIS